MGALGALSLLLNVDSALRALRPEQIDAAGGPNALKAAIIIQPTILVLAASALGLTLAHKIGLRSWVVDRLRGEADAPIPLLPSLLIGVAVGALIIGGDIVFAYAKPYAFSSLRAAEVNPIVSLFQGVLYGGLTEEILVRWGLLSGIAWLLVKVRLRTTIATWIAVVAAAMLFAAGHLPALAAAAELNAPLVARTLLLNAIGGLAFGTLFVRHNLESAMLAHMVAHLMFFIARLFGA